MTQPKNHALFPGTFDPVTLGHLDVLTRACALFEKVTVAVANHPEKRHLCSLQQRVELLERSVADLPGVDVISVDGLVVDACRELGASVIVRGVRSGTDFDYEVQMARTNRGMAEIDTVLLVPASEYSHISSSLVRQIATLGGDASPFVPAIVAEFLSEHCRDTH